MKTIQQIRQEVSDSTALAYVYESLTENEYLVKYENDLENAKDDIVACFCDEYDAGIVSESFLEELAEAHANNCELAL